MPQKKEQKHLYDYNIYKLPVKRTHELKEYLEERSFEEIPLKQSAIKNNAGFSFSLMFCDKNNKNGSPWVKLLESCAEWKLTHTLKIYGAALICKSKESCFVVSYGNAHFYISNFCDYTFGIAVAERLIDLDSIKSQQNVSQGSKISKTHTDYFSGATLTYHSGEIPTYIRGKSINSDDWGENINCGTSAQFKWEDKPTEIGERLQLLESALKQKGNISLPRLIQLDKKNDAERIDVLFHKLATAISEYDVSKENGNFINVPSFYLVGTKLLQNDSIRFKLSCKGRRKEYDGELSVQSIKDFLDEKKFDIFKVIQNINIAVEYANDQWGPYKPMIEYLEFVTDDNYCLRSGKWCTFNSSYLERIWQDLNGVPFKNCFEKPFIFSKEELIKFAKDKDIFKDVDKQPYETYYNEYLAKELGAICVHPRTVPVEEGVDGRYKFEICDLYLNGTMYFVKIGNPADFAYAIDQAMLTLEKIEINNNKIKLPTGETVMPKTFCLLLIFDKRKAIVNEWKDIYSINYLVHLSELKQKINSSNVSLTIKLMYEK